MANSIKKFWNKIFIFEQCVQRSVYESSRIEKLIENSKGIKAVLKKSQAQIHFQIQFAPYVHDIFCYN